MLHIAGGGTTECPRCTNPVANGAAYCPRCNLTFDAWGVGEPPPQVRKLLAKLDRTGGFPAISEHVLEVNRLIARNDTSADQLADVISRDYALTTRLLRLVNSAFYRQFNKPVATITRAVVLLGFEQVRQAAVSLILFDHLRNAGQQEELARRAIQAFTGGLIARALGEEQDDRQRAAEAMTCAMFHRLGDSLVLAFMPEEWEAIAAQADGGASKEDAERAVLGVTTEELGAAVARRWAFPESVVHSMRNLLDDHVRIPRTRQEWLHATACFANELADEAGRAEPEFDRIVGRYGDALSVSVPRIGNLLRDVASQVRAQAEALQLFTDGGDYVRNLIAWGATEGTPRAEAIRAADEETRRIVRNNGLDEVTAAVESGQSLNSVLAIVIETLYRGFEFDRVLLCIKDVRRPRMTARYGLGERIAHVVDEFGFDLHPEARDLFARACLAGKDVVIEDAGSPAVWRAIPKWYTDHVGAKGFVIYPLRVNGWPFGMLYADTARPRETLHRSRLINIKALRDQALLALEHHRRAAG